MVHKTTLALLACFACTVSAVPTTDSLPPPTPVPRAGHRSSNLLSVPPSSAESISTIHLGDYETSGRGEEGSLIPSKQRRRMLLRINTGIPIPEDVQQQQPRPPLKNNGKDDMLEAIKKVSEEVTESPQTKRGATTPKNMNLEGPIKSTVKTAENLKANVAKTEAPRGSLRDIGVHEEEDGQMSLPITRHGARKGTLDLGGPMEILHGKGFGPNSQLSLLDLLKTARGRTSKQDLPQTNVIEEVDEKGTPMVSGDQSLKGLNLGELSRPVPRIPAGLIEDLSEDESSSFMGKESCQEFLDRSYDNMEKYMDSIQLNMLEWIEAARSGEYVPAQFILALGEIADAIPTIAEYFSALVPCYKDPVDDPQEEPRRTLWRAESLKEGEDAGQAWDRHVHLRMPDPEKYPTFPDYLERISNLFDEAIVYVKTDVKISPKSMRQEFDEWREKDGKEIMPEDRDGAWKAQLKVHLGKAHDSLKIVRDRMIEEYETVQATGDAVPLAKAQARYLVQKRIEQICEQRIAWFEAWQGRKRILELLDEREKQRHKESKKEDARRFELENWMLGGSPEKKKEGGKLSKLCRCPAWLGKACSAVGKFFRQSCKDDSDEEEVDGVETMARAREAMGAQNDGRPERIMDWADVEIEKQPFEAASKQDLEPISQAHLRQRRVAPSEDRPSGFTRGMIYDGRRTPAPEER